MIWAIAPIDENQLLSKILADSVLLAIAIHTQKVSPETIVVPILTRPVSLEAPARWLEERGGFYRNMRQSIDVSRASRQRVADARSATTVHERSGQGERRSVPGQSVVLGSGG